MIDARRRADLRHRPSKFLQRARLAQDEKFLAAKASIDPGDLGGAVGPGPSASFGGRGGADQQAILTALAKINTTVAAVVGNTGKLAQDGIISRYAPG